MTREGDLLWEPGERLLRESTLSRYMRWLGEERGVRVRDYDELWRWSVRELEAFWSSIWDFFHIRAHAPARTVLAERRMPGARWFEGSSLNYAEHVLSDPDDRPALLVRSEAGPPLERTRRELTARVGAVAAGLRRLGVGRGDRVAAFLPNGEEAVLGLLAAASLGAIWSSCSPEFGVAAVTDRFRQIEPKVLLAVEGYRYGGRDHDRRSVVSEIAAALPNLERVIVVPGPGERPSLPDAMPWDDLTSSAAEPTFEPVPFDHPLWILYSSGTTGLPKAMVQGHGGILLEHLKVLGLHFDLGADDRFFWFTTTGWMMWNVLVSGLAVGSSIVVFDGSPAHPDLGALWRLAEETGISYLGTSAPFLHACLKAGLAPAERFDLGRLRAIGSTGAPLSPEGFAWVKERVGADVWLGSISGGTDVCSAFVGSCPLLPVHAGELQCRLLGSKVEAFDEQGRSVVGEVGELVLTEPMPSMPVSFWRDPGDERYRASYFEEYPGVWRHGDWIKITERGTCVIYGRSDATLNRGGIRVGTSELYRIVESLPGVADSLVIDTGAAGREGELLLFVVPEDRELDDALRREIASALRTGLSPRHVPDRIVAVGSIPKTLNGKRLEVPIKRLFAGEPPEAVASPDALTDPSAFRAFVDLARELSAKGG